MTLKRDSLGPTVSELALLSWTLAGAVTELIRQKWLPWAVLGGVAASIFSIALSNVLFGLAILLWLWDCWFRRKIYLRFPIFSPYLLAFVGAVLLAIVFSQEVGTSLPYLRKLLKFLYVFLIFTYVQEDQARKALCLVFVLAGLSAAYAVGQYYWFLEVNLLNRVRGFMSHWMTFGGQLMLASVALTAQLLFGRLQKARVPADANRSAPAIPICGSGPFRRVPWVTLLGLLLFALILTLTRSAWVGTTAGIFVLLAARNIRWTGLISGCVLVLFLLLPDSFQERVYSGFDLRDVTTRIRVELFLTGKNILRSHPWTGVGPRLVPKVYEEYKLSAEFPEWAYQHLHNDFIQIGADMGLIGLFTWSALWARVLWDLGMKMRSSQPGRNTDLTAAGLGAVIAFLCAGLFEYNFGDAEVLILLLFLITAPYVGKLPRQQAT